MPINWDEIEKRYPNTSNTSNTTTTAKKTGQGIDWKRLERKYAPPFNPEGEDYDYNTAEDAGMAADQTGHWGSLDPRTGLVLKGRNHKTWDLTVQEEEKLGNEIVKDKQSGRYFSRPSVKALYHTKALALDEELKSAKEAVNMTVDPQKSAEARARVYNLEFALNRYKRLAEPPKLIPGLAAGIKETLKDPAKLIPFAGSILQTNLIFETAKARTKAEKGETLSDYERSLLELEAVKQQGLTSGEMAGGLAANIPTYAMEFASTGGVKQIAQKAVESQIRKFLGRRSSKILAGTVGATAQSLANVPEIVERTAQKISDGLSPVRAVNEAVLTNAIDYTTEYAGRYLRLPKFIKKSDIVANLRKLQPDKVKSLARKIGWQGLPGEIFEEELAELFSAPVERRPYAAPIITEEGNKRFLIEALGIGVFGGISGGAGLAAGALTRRENEQNRLNAIATQAVAVNVLGEAIKAQAQEELGQEPEAGQILKEVAEGVKAPIVEEQPPGITQGQPQGEGKVTLSPQEVKFRDVLTKRGINIPDNLEITYVVIDNPSDPKAKAIVTVRPRSADEGTVSGDRFNIEIAPGEDAVTLYNIIAKEFGRKQLSQPQVEKTKPLTPKQAKLLKLSIPFTEELKELFPKMKLELDQVTPFRGFLIRDASGRVVNRGSEPIGGVLPPKWFSKRAGGFSAKEIKSLLEKIENGLPITANQAQIISEMVQEKKRILQEEAKRDGEGKRSEDAGTAGANRQEVEGAIRSGEEAAHRGVAAEGFGVSHNETFKTHEEAEKRLDQVIAAGGKGDITRVHADGTIEINYWTPEELEPGTGEVSVVEQNVEALGETGKNLTKVPYEGWMDDYYETPEWVQIWKEHPELRGEMLTYEMYKSKDIGIDFAWDPAKYKDARAILDKYGKVIGYEDPTVSGLPKVGEEVVKEYTDVPLPSRQAAPQEPVLPIDPTETQQDFEFEIGRGEKDGLTVIDLIRQKKLTPEQVIDTLKKYAVREKAAIEKLERVLLEEFNDLLAPEVNRPTPLTYAYTTTVIDKTGKEKRVLRIGRTGTIVDQAFIEMLPKEQSGRVTDDLTKGYRYKEGDDLNKWLNYNAKAAIYRTIMRLRVATRSEGDAKNAAIYIKARKELEEELGRAPSLYEIAARAQFYKTPEEAKEQIQGPDLFATLSPQSIINKGNLLKALEMRDLVEFAEGRVPFSEEFTHTPQQKMIAKRKARKKQMEEQYAMTEDAFEDEFDAEGAGIERVEAGKPERVTPIVDKIIFATSGGRQISEVYEKGIGPALQMSKAMKKWLGSCKKIAEGRYVIKITRFQRIKEAKFGEQHKTEYERVMHVINHESGHFLDSILGKIELPKDMRDELIRLSKTIIPFEEKFIVGISKKTGKVTKRMDRYSSYRRSRGELMADYLSLYTSNPERAKELAPSFTANIEGLIARNKEFSFIIDRLREFNAELKPLFDYVESLGSIPEIIPDLVKWVEQGNMLQSLWRNNIGRPLWSKFSSVVDSIGRRKKFSPFFEKRGLDDRVFEIIRQMRHLIDGQVHKVEEEIIKPLSQLGEKDQEFIRDALMKWEQLPEDNPFKNLTESTRKALALWGNEARKLGLLNDLVFFDNVGQYFPFFYTSKEFAKNKSSIGGISQKKLRANLSSFKHRLTDEEMGRKALELRIGTWPSQKAKIDAYSKDELIAIGKKVREEMGLMKTAAYPLEKRFRSLIQSVYTTKALNLIAATPGIIGSRDMAGYVQLPEGKSLGNLAGQWVPENIAKEINSFGEKVDEISSMIETIVGVYKAFKVPWDPAACTRNFFTNLLELWMGDVPPTAIGAGINSFLSKNSTYQLLRDHGLYRHTYAKEELKKLAFLVETEPKNNLALIAKWATLAFETPGNIYGAIEDMCKTIGAAYVLSKGGSPMQAVAFADRLLFDYSSVSQAVAKARKLPIPFLTWSAKMFPLLVETAIVKPEKYIFFYLLLAVISAYSRQLLGLSRDEEESMKPDYMKGADNAVLLLPYRDKQNQVQWIDLSYFTPWGGWLQPINKKTFVPQPLQLSNPFMSLYNAYVQNYDPFSGQIAGDWMTEAEKKEATNRYVFQSMAPKLLSRTPEQIVKAVKGTPDRFGRRSSLKNVLLNQTFGIKITPGGETTTRVGNWAASQKEKSIEVNRTAKLAWKEYVRNKTPQNLNKARVLMNSVDPISRRRLHIDAVREVRNENRIDKALREMSRRKLSQFKKYEKTLK